MNKCSQIASLLIFLFVGIIFGWDKKEVKQTLLQKVLPEVSTVDCKARNSGSRLLTAWNNLFSVYCCGLSIG